MSPFCNVPVENDSRMAEAKMIFYAVARTMSDGPNDPDWYIGVA